MCESRLKVELIDLARYGTRARSLLGSPHVIIGEYNDQSKFRRGDILDANAIDNYMLCCMTEHIQKPFNDVYKEIYSLVKLINNLREQIDQLKEEISTLKTT